MLFGSPFEIVQYTEIQTRQTCLELLPNDVAAVYAWFRNLTLPENVLASESQFIEEILALLNKPLVKKRDGYIRHFYKIGITMAPGSLTPKKKRSLMQYAKSQNNRMEIGRALEALTFLQPPLYVGKAKKGRLPNRIWEHINGSTSLDEALQEVDLSLRDCILTYLPISDPEFPDSETSMTRLVEDIITRLSTPGFIGRIG